MALGGLIYLCFDCLVVLLFNVCCRLLVYFACMFICRVVCAVYLRCSLGWVCIVWFSARLGLVADLGLGCLNCDWVLLIYCCLIV